MPILETEALTRRFGNFTAVDGLTMGVEARHPSRLLRLPAGQPHAVKAVTRFTMILIMIRA
jgi:ABC-type branched-subunit amino acid transport system ATPase component